MNADNIIQCIINCEETGQEWYSLLADTEIGIKDIGLFEQFMVLLPQKQREYLQKCIDNAIIFHKQYPNAKSNGRTRHDK